MAEHRDEKNNEIVKFNLSKAQRVIAIIIGCTVIVGGGLGVVELRLDQYVTKIELAASLQDVNWGLREVRIQVLDSRRRTIESDIAALERIRREEGRLNPRDEERLRQLQYDLKAVLSDLAALRELQRR